jgi:TIR domain/Pentapeptide repeats (8 copies)
VANPEHLKILKQGVKLWNDWRKANPQSEPDVSGVDLEGANLRGINLGGSYHPELGNLGHIDLEGINLSNADLRDAHFNDARLFDACLSGANCENANFAGANLARAYLIGTNFRHAELGNVDFSEAKLEGANFSYVALNASIFGENDLSKVKGLETVAHRAPSIIGIDVIYYSKGKIPEVFLRGCGIPESFIVQIPALVGSIEPIQFYKCFISYSSKDQKFADRLYADLQNKGVRCWLASEDLKIGDRIRVGIDEAIRLHDKLMLVLSQHSVASDWVEQEVETALARERKEKRAILFPIRLDDAVMKIDKGWPALVKNTRNIGDFRKWKNYESYSKAFDRLLRDLKAKEKKL